MNFNPLKFALRAVLLSLLMSFGLSALANDYKLSKSYYDHLSTINKEWEYHKEACPQGTISFNSDIDRIQLHLNLVIEHLTSNIPLRLNATQRANRLSLLGKLQHYADNKVYPINKYHSVRQPYFVDDYGTNCAVGQMIYVSGHEKLVAKISKEHNYDYIKDIQTEGVLEWADEFGFTIEELKWIQPAYSPTANVNQVLNGTNGKVKKIVNNNWDGSLIIAGEFTELDSLPCLNIGIYKNDQLACLGDGVEGIVNDAIYQSGDVYAFGELYHNGQVFPIAKYDGSTWSYIGIPGREEASSTAAYSGGSGYQYKVVINHSSIPQQQEIWHYLNDNTWLKIAKVNGLILDIVASGYGRVHAGHFDSVTVYNSNETVDTTLTVNNVVINSNYTNHWFGIGDNISDTVNVVRNIGNTLIFGGTCNIQPGESKVCLSRYYNSVLQPLLINEYYTDNYSIHSIAYNGGNEFIFGGEFEIIPVVGTYGNNLASYNLVYNNIEALANLDKPVNTLAYFKKGLYIGGDFQTNRYSESVNYLGRITSTTGIKESLGTKALTIYPNPFSSTITMEGVQDGVSYSLLYIDGRVAKKGTVLDEKITDLDHLPKGAYLLQLETTAGVVARKVYK